MRAIILAGGKGTRLKPYTSLIPKPLVPIGEKYSILEIVIYQLRQSGFNHITITLNHLSRLIMAYFGDGSDWGIKIDYSIETEPLSTIGPLTLIDDLPDNFLVMNGDILSNLDYTAFFNKHVNSGAHISVSGYKRTVKIDFGVLEYNEQSVLTDFREKPEEEFCVSMGIYALNRNIIDQLQKNKPYGFDNLMLDSLKQDNPVNIFPFEGFWLDIGRPDDYEYACENYEEILTNMSLKDLL